MSRHVHSRSREDFALYLYAGVPLTLFVMSLILRHQRKEAQRRFFAWRFVLGCAEDMSSIPSDSIDCVVSTLVLCSVEDMASAIREIKRILVRGGCFYYVEHIGYKEGSWSRRLQRLVQPLWSLISDGCQLTRDVPQYVEFLGFREMFETIHYPPEMPFLVRPTLVGKAIK
ncbi:hypothetical protein HPB50_005818 [Hyalomma asiaticum]|uniref:Uncharacterized protein n=1 Tax=Hyalomma asiaticum TaxID=266040 RepID=A0ACB7SL75_HYAAI|nr:hypothetical protein HPB50_005818 [Hyalomma asiaticum]